MKKFRQCVLFGLLFFGFMGCQKKEVQLQNQIAKEKAILRINIKDDPNTLDPRRARDTTSLTLIKMCFDGLTRIGKDDVPELALAKTVKISEDLKKFVFYLRPSVWTNGDPVTAADFVYSWKKTLDPKFASDCAYQLYVIKNAKAFKEGKVSHLELGVRALDLMTLEVELEQPIPYFLELVAFPTFFPVHSKVDTENPKWAEKTDSYVCNGPFRLKEWKHQNSLVVEKNPSYWDTEVVKLDEIQMAMVQEETELKMYEMKELDWAGSPLSTLPIDALANLKNQGVIQTKPILGTYFLRSNVQRAPLDHLLMRKAFALAINRKEIVEHVTQGNQIPATALVPTALNLQKEPYFNDGDLGQAKALFQKVLEERKVSLEDFPKITLTYSSNERNHRIAQALQQQWFQAFGINVQLEPVEQKVFFDRLSKQDYQLAAGSWLADFNDPINFLEVFKYKSSGTNNTLWEDTNYANLLDNSSKVVDTNLRMKVLSQSERILMDQMPIIPIFHYTMLYVKKEALNDVILSSLGNLDFKWAYLVNPK